MGKITGNNSPATTTVTDASGAVMTVPANTGEIPPFHARPDSLDEGAVYNPMPQRIAPMWPLDSPLDITVIVSPTFVAEPLGRVEKERVVMEEKGFIFGDYKENRVIDTEFDVPKAVQNNGTLWAHFYVGLSGNKLDPAAQGYDPSRAFHFMHPLTQYIAQKKIKKTKNLLAATEENEEVSAIALGNELILIDSSLRRKSQLVQSLLRITIQTSPSLSSRTRESCTSHLFILLLVNSSDWKQVVHEMLRVRTDGITPFSSSTPSGNSRRT
jgi:hypothetical protein